MNKIFADAIVGRKNIGFGVLLFVFLGVVAGIPLTVDFLGGSMLSESQYQTWKVLHGYGVFLAFVNFFFGYCIDQLNLTKRQKEISSWLFVIAGFAGGFGRSFLFIFSSLGGVGAYAISLIETAGFVLGTFVFVQGLIKGHSERNMDKPTNTIPQLH